MRLRVTSLVYFLRSAAAILVATFVTLAFFGLLLALFWSFAGDQNFVKLVSAFLAAALAVMVGGFTLTWTSKTHGLVLPTIFGFVFSILSFGYILGPDLRVMAFAIACALLAALGGLIYRRLLGEENASTNPALGS